tara:strand:- start:5041 stop:6873 length:1833 start_codon:yes stop_codon:yes gene_type:complete
MFEDHQNSNIKHMKTNEFKRNEADRRIPLNSYDMMGEVTGNMSGYERKIHYSDNFTTLYTYTSDGGFSPDDKVALLRKNESGDNMNNTAGLNGHGIKLVIDRVIPPDHNQCVFAQVISLDDSMSCYIGHFKYIGWNKISNQNEIDNILDMMDIRNKKTGSLFIIPLNDEYQEKFRDMNDKLRLACNKFNNKKIYNNEIEFYWQNEKQNVDELCPACGALELDYEIGHFKKNEHASTNTKSTILKILNYSNLENHIKNKIGEYAKINESKGNKNQDLSYNDFDNKDTFYPIDSGHMRLSIISCEIRKYEKNVKIEDYDGVHIFLNGFNINLKASKKRLGIEVSTDRKEYYGRPRFENHVSKNTKQYNFPMDKGNSKATTLGESVQRYMRNVARLILTEKRKLAVKTIQKLFRHKLMKFKLSSNQGASIPVTAPVSPFVPEPAVVVPVPSLVVAPASLLTPTSSPTPISPLAPVFPPTPVSSPAPASSPGHSEPRHTNNNTRTSQDDFPDPVKSSISSNWYQYCCDNNMRADKCLLCEQITVKGLGNAMEYAHIKSWKAGGKPVQENCIFLCKKCNCSMQDKYMLIFIQEKYQDDDKTERFKEHLKNMGKQV